MNRCELLRSAMDNSKSFLQDAKKMLEEIGGEPWQPPESDTDLSETPLHFGKWFCGEETWNGIKNYELDRLTNPVGSYCKDRCGMYKSCSRIEENDFCKDVMMYEKLKLYENTGLTPAFVEMVFQAYLRVITKKIDDDKGVE